jgi:hypothetical protein
MYALVYHIKLKHVFSVILTLAVFNLSTKSIHSVAAVYQFNFLRLCEFA